MKNQERKDLEKCVYVYIHVCVCLYWVKRDKTEEKTFREKCVCVCVQAVQGQGAETGEGGQRAGEDNGEFAAEPGQGS